MRTSCTLVALAGLALLLASCTHIAGPQADFSIGPSDHGFPPLEVALDASASSSPNGAIVSYDWDLGDGATASGATTTHTYAEKGVYAITLMVTDSTGATGARTRSVEALNRVPVASFTVDKYWVNKNEPIEFDASDSYDTDGEIVRYVWSFGDGTTGEGMVVEHEYGLVEETNWQPVVTLTVIDEDGGSKSTSKKVNVVGCGSCSS